MHFLSLLPFSFSSTPPKTFCNFSIKRNNVVKGSCQNSHENRQSDVIIVGAGVAGSALAQTLAKDGRRVHVIERDLREPKRVVGEVLQPAGYLKLLELGLEDCVRDIDAQLVLGYAVYKEGKSVKLPYPLENYDTHVAGRSFHNGRFVQKLRCKAASHPNVKLEEGTVISLIEERGVIKGVTYKAATGDKLTAFAPLTVVCDGCFSRLRNLLSKPKIDKPSHIVCLTVENCEVPHPNYGHAIMGNPSTILMYAISSTEIRFMIDFPGSKLPPIANGEMARFLKTVVAPQIPREMYNSFVLSIEKGGIKTMPVRCMPGSPCHTPGALLIGDAFNMRHSLTGVGMTVALQDVTLLSDLFTSLNLDETSTLINFTRHFYSIRKSMVFSMNVMADSLHKILCATGGDEELRNQLQHSFLNYLSLGNIVVRGQSLLISGLNSHPLFLALNLFAAAIYLFAAMLFTIPAPRKLYAVAQLFLGTAAGVIPMILDDGLRHAFSAKNCIPKPAISDSMIQK